MSRAVADPLAERLASVVGSANVLTAPEMTAGYVVDWTGRWGGPTRAVVRPGTVDEVVRVVRACRGEGVSLIPQGGNTGLVGGGVPRRAAGDQVVLSLTRLSRLGPVEETALQVEAQAGVTLARVQAEAGAAGLAFAVDLAARDTATVGGMVATNAGGLHVLRYGSMRAQLVGVEAVMADGSVMRRMDGLLKDNSGYDLPGLLCGSEGTLAIVTDTRLRLVPRPAHRVTALVGVADLSAGLDVLAATRRLSSLDAVEVMFADGIDLVCAHGALPQPFARRHSCVLTIECAGERDPTDDLAAALAGVGGVADTAVSADTAGRAALWAWRERHTEAVNALGIPHKLDVTLPLTRLVTFEAEVRRLVAAVAPTAVTVIWGHLGDGNLHVNVVGPASDDELVDEAVLRLVADCGGSISAEHGIGVAKTRWLGLTRSPADLAAMAAVKNAFDPNGLLNPGVLLPPRLASS